MEVKNCLYELMKVKDIRVKELADMTGLSEVAICKIRNNHPNCKVATLITIADALDVSLDLLLCREKDERIALLKNKIGSIKDPLHFYNYLLNYEYEEENK